MTLFFTQSRLSSKKDDVTEMHKKGKGKIVEDFFHWKWDLQNWEILRKQLDEMEKKKKISKIVSGFYQKVQGIADFDDFLGEKFTNFGHKRPISVGITYWY